MDAYKAIVTKRDTRDFRDRPVAEDDLGKLLNAARMAGSAKNQQVNRIVVVTDAGDRTELGACGNFAGWVPAAAAVFVLVMPEDGGRPFDLGRMAQNMLVTAHSLGLASCPVTFHHSERVRGLLGIPGGYEASMGVAVGHPSGGERASAPRIPLEELAHRGRWQN
jgi:nitroreductase